MDWAAESCALQAHTERLRQLPVSPCQEELGLLVQLVQRLLEDDSTPLERVSHVLELLEQVALRCSPASMGTSFQDIIDLLLGWSLDPSLPPAYRPLFSRCFLAFRKVWQERPAFTTALLGKVLSDMEALAAKIAEEEVEVQWVHRGRLLALTNCFAGVVAGAGAVALGAQAGTLLIRLGNCLRNGVKSFWEVEDPGAGGLPRGPASRRGCEALVAQCCSALAALACVAAEVAERDIGGAVAGVGGDIPNWRSTASLLGGGVDTETLDIQKLPKVLEQFNNDVTCGMGRAGATCARMLLPLLTLRTQKARLEAAAAKGASDGTAKLTDESLEMALGEGGTGGETVAMHWQHQRAELLAEGAQPALLLMRHARLEVRKAALSAMTTTLEALVAKRNFPAAPAIDLPSAPRELLTTVGARLVFGLGLLQAAARELSADEAALDATLRVCVKLGDKNEVRQAVGRLLLALLEYLQQPTDKTAVTQSRCPSVCRHVDNALGRLRAVCRRRGLPDDQAMHYILLAGLTYSAESWMQCRCAIFEGRRAAILTSFAVDQCVSVLADSSSLTSSDTPTRLRATKLLAVIWHHCQDRPDLSHHQVMTVFELLCTALGDRTPEVVVAAATAVSAGLPPRKRHEIATVAAAPTNTGSVAGLPTLLWKRAVAFEPLPAAPHGSLEPSEVVRLLEMLGGNVPPGGQLWAWMERFVDICGGRAAASSTLLTATVTQRAASHLVVTKLRTQHGSATQTFAHLEKILQGWATWLNAVSEGKTGSVRGVVTGKLVQTPAASPTGPLPFEVAWVLLELVEALERGMYSAHEGSLLRAPLPWPVASFYAANRKVCEDWFAKLRVSALQAAYASGHQHAILSQALSRLANLNNLVRTFATTPSGSSTKPQGEAAPAATSQQQPPPAASGSGKETMTVLTAPRKKEIVCVEGTGGEGIAVGAVPVLKLRQTDRAPDGGAEEKGTSRHKMSGWVIHALHMAAGAMLALREEESLKGLHIWARRSFAYHFAAHPPTGQATGEGLAQLSIAEGAECVAWMEGAALQAGGRYEDALVSFWRVLEGDSQRVAGGTPPRLASESVAWVTARMGECYAAVADWTGLEDLLARLQDLRSELPGTRWAACLEPPMSDVNGYLSLAHYDEGNLQEAKSLTRNSPWRLTREAGITGKPITCPKVALTCAGDLTLQAMIRSKIKTENEGTDAGASGSPALLARDKALLGAEQLLLRLLRCQASQDVSMAGAASALREVHLLREARNQRVRPSLSASSREGCDTCRNLAGVGDGAGAGAADDAATCLRLLRCLKAASSFQLADRDKAVRDLSCSAIYTALRSRNYKLAARLGASLPAQSTLSQEVTLTAMAMTAGDAAGSALALGRVWNRLSPLLLRPIAPGADAPAEEVAQASLAVAEWLITYPGLPLPSLVEDAEKLLAESEELPSTVMTSLASDVGWSESSAREAWSRLARSSAAYPSDIPFSAAIALCLGTAASVAPGMATAWKMWGSWCVHRVDDVKLSSPDEADERRWLALTAYLRFIAMIGGCSCSWNTPQQHTGILLTVLALLEKLGPGTEDTALAAHLSSAPPAVWQAVTPQLFARMANASRATAGSNPFQAILKVVASGCPATILFPAAAQVRMAEASGQEEPEEAVTAILACIQSIQPELLTETLSILRELDRVAVLWEEVWHSVLAEAQVDVSRRVQKLKMEATRVEENTALDLGSKVSILRDKYLALMQPLLGLLDRTWRATMGAGASTPREQWFVAKYEARLVAEMAKLREPPPGVSSGEGAAYQWDAIWSGMKAIAVELSKDTKLMGGSMSELSPALVGLRGTQMPLPGVSSAAADIASMTGAPAPITVQSFGDKVQFLNTKTRPKKLTIIADDGQHYDFLLKGREDLHMDARIMQVMGLLDAQLAGASAETSGLSLRQYSITPLGNRVGLVQWVQNSVPLYSLFKQWQTRSVEASAAKSVQPPDGAAQRPVELYYRHLTAALQEAGLQAMVPRHMWPKEVQEKVLSGLKRTVPARLLAMELWASSAGPADWWARQTAYSQSCAVSSIAGWLLGLGDRHLDNILLDKVSGAVVHIDYNVCLERGKHLKVPEVVPFRLTQMLAAALGLTGVAGVFRHAAVVTMVSMRRNAADLQALLAACLDDPLVDWGADRKDAAARAEMETAVSLDLLASRYDEVRGTLSSTSAALAAALPVTAGELRQLLEAHTALLAAAADANSKHLERERLTRALREASSGEQAAYISLQEATITLNGAQEHMAEVKNALAAEAHKFQAWQEQHKGLVGRLTGMRVPELLQPEGDLLASAAHCELGLVSGLRMRTDTKKYGAVVAALGSMAGMVAAPPELGQRWGAVDAHAGRLLQQRDNAVAAARSALQEYSAACILLLPSDYAANSFHGAWSNLILGVLSPSSGDETVLVPVRPTFPVAAQPEQAKCRWKTLRSATQLVDARAAEAEAATASLPSADGAAHEAEAAALAAFLAAPPSAVTSALSALMAGLSSACAGSPAPQPARSAVDVVLNGVCIGSGCCGLQMANRLQVLTSSLTEVASAAGFTAASEALKPLAEVLDVVAGLGGSLSVSVVGGLLSAAESYGSAQGWQAHAGSLAARGTTPLSIAATALDHHTRQYEATVNSSPEQQTAASNALESELNAALGGKVCGDVLKALLAGTEELKAADQKLVSAMEDTQLWGESDEALRTSSLPLVLVHWIVLACPLIDAVGQESEGGSLSSLATSDIALAVDKAIDGVMLKYLNERIVPILGRLAGALATQQRVDAPTGGAGSTGITAPHPSQAERDLEAEWAMAAAATAAGEGGFFGALPEEEEVLEGVGDSLEDGSSQDSTGWHASDVALSGEMRGQWGGIEFDAAAGQEFFGDLPSGGDALEALEPNGAESVGAAFDDSDDDAVDDEFLFDEGRSAGQRSAGELMPSAEELDVHVLDVDNGTEMDGASCDVWRALTALASTCCHQAATAQLTMAAGSMLDWSQWRATLDLRKARLEWSSERALITCGLVSAGDNLDAPPWPTRGALVAGGSSEGCVACERAGWTLQSRRAALLRTMRAAHTTLRQAMEGMAGWARTSAAASAEVERYVSAALMQSANPNAQAAVAALQERLAARAAWLHRSNEAVGALTRTCEAAVLFEDSCDGDEWMPAGHAATRLSGLVESLLAGRATARAAEGQVTESQATASKCHAEAAQHAQALETVRATSMEAAKRFEALAPRLMETVSSAAAGAGEFTAIAETALPLVQDVATMMRQACKVLEGADAARDFLTVAAPVSSAWQAHSITLSDLLPVLYQLSATAAAHHHLLNPPPPPASQQQQSQPQAPPSLPGRAARVLEALRPTMTSLTAVMAQVEVLAAAFGKSSAAQEVEDLVGAAAGVAASIRQEHEFDLEEGEAAAGGGGVMDGDVTVPIKVVEKANIRARAAEPSHQRSAASQNLVTAAMRRFQEKLEGVEAEGGGRALGVEEHVDLLLGMATKSDRLAQMYEGWAAWI